MVIADKRDPLGKMDELCIMPQSMRPTDTFEDKLKEWTKNIFYFRDECKDKNQWKDLKTEEDEKKKELIDIDEAKKLEKIRDYDLE